MISLWILLVSGEILPFPVRLSVLLCFYKGTRERKRRTIAAAPNATGALCVGADCDCPHGCSSNGECINGECKCYAGFTYYDCSLKVCPSDCSGNGFCYNATCHCHPGWRGSTCASLAFDGSEHR